MADDGPPVAGSTDADGELRLRELSELRDLLFGGERRQLDELRRRLDTLELTPEELAERLPEAIALRASRDRQLALALAPTVEAAISESVRRNPREIATAIFPVLGPSIRKAIAETMAGIVNAINRGIENSFSPQGIRWRIESWRTGVPFAQIVIRHGLVYRVEQVFLIHCETGLLLAHVPEGSSDDADLISGMLTAIQDFVNDSFEPRATGELRAFAAGELNILVETGPKAYIAAVVRGQPPDTLLGRLQGTLETIHAQWSTSLAGFDGDAKPFATAHPLLDSCVETVLSTDAPKKRSGIARFARVIPLVLIAAGLVWWRTAASRRWSSAVSRLEQEPGLVLIRSERSGGRWQVTGLRDPLAADPARVLATMGIDSTDVVARWRPYISTEPALLLARARQSLAPPAGVTLGLTGDTIVATGRAPSTWVNRAQTLAPALTGIGAADFSRVEPGLPSDMESLRAAIEAQRVLFTAGSAALGDSARAIAATIAARFNELAAAARRNRYDVALAVVGRADPSGSEQGNLSLSRQRASALRDLVISLGVPASAITAVAAGSSDPIEGADPVQRPRLNRSVSFAVRAQPGAGGNAERIR